MYKAIKNCLSCNYSIKDRMLQVKISGVFFSFFRNSIKIVTTNLFSIFVCYFRRWNFQIKFEITDNSNPSFLKFFPIFEKIVQGILSNRNEWNLSELVQAFKKLLNGTFIKNITKLTNYINQERFVTPFWD